MSAPAASQALQRRLPAATPTVANHFGLGSGIQIAAVMVLLVAGCALALASTATTSSCWPTWRCWRSSASVSTC